MISALNTHVGKYISNIKFCGKNNNLPSKILSQPDSDCFCSSSKSVSFGKYEKKHIDDVEHTVVNKFVKNHVYQLYIRMPDGKRTGYCEYSDGVLMEGFPEEYKDGKDSLCIDVLFSEGEYKGVGTKLIKNAVMQSIKLGHEGRIYLLACSSNVGNPEWKSKSPVPFYYNLGFRFRDEDYNHKIEAGLKEAKETGIYPKDVEEASGIMYLPKASIEKILSKM